MLNCNLGKSIGCYVLSFSEEHNVYLQQDGFLDKELVRVADLDKSKTNQSKKWSWDRILRSPYIKQADVLQCFYFFEDHFSKN
jgi:maltose phosphorylase